MNQIWLTDRSRFSTGLGRCRRERYLTYHSGTTGYGLVRRGEAIPLSTGTTTHKPYETIFKHLQISDTFPGVPEIRAAIGSALLDYEKLITEKGFRGLLASERAEYIIEEQKALVTGLVWAGCRTVLPWIHKEYKILDVELETGYMLECSCGLGSGVLDLQTHAARGCQGIGIQLRQDVIAQKRQGGGLAYFEIKTTGFTGDSWTSAWETKPQLTIGSYGLRERYQRDLSETFVIGLYKGSRKTKGEGSDAIKVQQTPLCYGRKKAGNPPLATDDWRPAYEWVNEDGVTQYARRPYEDWPIWELPQSDWRVWHDAKTADPTLTPAEFWIAWLPQSVLEKACFLVGPMNPQSVQHDVLKRQIAGEERRWQADLWTLYETGREWSDPLFQEALDRIVPASWDCRRFGAQHECTMADLCFKRSGWEDPIGSGKYVPRRPHHVGELNAAIERGLLPAEAEGSEEEE